MKNRDLAAFVVLYLSSIAVLGFVIFFWYENFGWRYLWALGIVLMVLALLFGYLFARYALSPLAERNAQLDRLVADTLHELNIPVATIKANAQMLKRDADDRIKTRLERIEAAADQLLGLYREVDYLIKKEIDRIEAEDVAVDELIEDRVEFFADLIGSRRIVLDLEPTLVRLPRQGFIKVFDNLLSNAIKYSPDGSTITILLKNGKLLIKDEGEGIDSSELVRIFDRYYRGRKDERGYGIGLDIVKTFCDENGIEIRIESKKGAGTSVYLNLTDT